MANPNYTRWNLKPTPKKINIPASASGLAFARSKLTLAQKNGFIKLTVRIFTARAAIG